jgi:hypothetical protein
MSYFAKIENGLVTQVIVADQAFVSSQPGTWVETFTDGSQRKNYAGIGHTYDSSKDAFIAPKPSQYPSWVLNDTTCRWNPPVSKPTDGQMYQWNEPTTSWTVVAQAL